MTRIMGFILLLLSVAAILWSIADLMDSSPYSKRSTITRQYQDGSAGETRILHPPEKMIFLGDRVWAEEGTVIRVVPAQAPELLGPGYFSRQDPRLGRFGKWLRWGYILTGMAAGLHLLRLGKRKKQP